MEMGTHPLLLLLSLTEEYPSRYFSSFPAPLPPLVGDSRDSGSGDLERGNGRGGDMLLSTVGKGGERFLPALETATPTV